MLSSQSEVEQHIKRHGIKQLTAMDNSGLFVNSNNYSKKTKQLVLDQQEKARRKARRAS